MKGADLRAEVVAVEEALKTEGARVECLEYFVAAGADKRQLLLAKRWEKSETASRQLAENEELLQELQSKVATITAERREWRELAAETAEELKSAEAGVVLQSRFRDDTQEDMDFQTAELAELYEQLATTNPMLWQLSPKHSKLNVEPGDLKSQHAASVSVLDDLTSAAGARERPAKRAKR